MKHISILFFLFSTLLFSQKEYIQNDHLIYDFLERMHALHIIEKYDLFSIPKTRQQVSNYILEIESRKDKLDRIDKQILKIFQIEFEFDLYGSTENYHSIINDSDYLSNFDKEKYFYYYNKKEKFNIFINLLGEFGSLKYFNRSNSNTAATLKGGGSLRGTILNKFGFYLEGTNGNVFGNKAAALNMPGLDFNFKLNERPENRSFDNTSGYLTADFDYINFKLGRDRQQIGYGKLKPVLSDHSPMFDYVGININYNFFTFSYFHGKLLGREFPFYDNEIGYYNKIEEKYLVYHRLGFNISRTLNFGLGEMIIYGNRSFDLSYFNPFTFYKSIEHDNRDRDNSLMFIDVSNNSIRGLTLFGMLIIDDMAFSKIGTNWFGNQTLIHTGLMSSNFYNILPVDVRLEYLRISPYFFTHRIPWNNYTNYSYPLGTELQPNSDLFFSEINYRLTNTIRVGVEYMYMRHGANPVNDDGKIMKNVGGDRLIGHRLFDSDESVFLSGDLEITRQTSLIVVIEPFNNLFVTLIGNLRNESLQNEVNKQSKSILILISIKI